MPHISVAKRQERKILSIWFLRQSGLKIIHKKTGNAHLNPCSIIVQKMSMKNKNLIHQIRHEIPTPAQQHPPLQKRCQNAMIRNTLEKNNLLCCRTCYWYGSFIFPVHYCWNFIFRKKVLTTDPLYVKIYVKIFYDKMCSILWSILPLCRMDVKQYHKNQIRKDTKTWKK